MDDPTSTAPANNSDATPRALAIVVIVLVVQALGLLVAMAVLVAKTVSGEPDSMARSLFGAAFALAGAVALVLAGRGFLGGRRGGRTLVLVLELLSLPVGNSLAFQAHRAAYGVPILVSAIAVIVLLFLPQVNAALDRPADESADTA